MATQKHYKRAPITEAVIELQLTLPDATSLAELRATGEAESTRYPQSQALMNAEAEVKIGGMLSFSAKQEPIGFTFTSEDGAQAFQARTNGFCFSRLAPYTSWEPVCAETKRLWTHYRALNKPTLIQRLSVRYLNRFEIPGDIVDFEKYFRVYPEVPDQFGQLHGVFSRLVVPVPEVDGFLLLTQSLMPPVRAGVTSILLDIDVIRASNVPQEEDAIWSLFDALRVQKNRIFEACITDAARELIS